MATLRWVVSAIVENAKSSIFSVLWCLELISALSGQTNCRKAGSRPQGSTSKNWGSSSSSAIYGHFQSKKNAKDRDDWYAIRSRKMPLIPGPKMLISGGCGCCGTARKVRGSPPGEEIGCSNQIIHGIIFFSFIFLIYCCSASSEISQKHPRV